MVIATCLKRFVWLRSPSHLSLFKNHFGFRLLNFSSRIVMEFSWKKYGKTCKFPLVKISHSFPTSSPLFLFSTVSSSPTTATWLRLRGFCMESRGPVVVVGLSFGFGGKKSPQVMGTSSPWYIYPSLSWLEKFNNVLHVCI